MHRWWWIVLTVVLSSAAGVVVGEPVHSWTAADRAEQVARLIPGRQIPMPKPEHFMAEATASRVEAWLVEHPDWSAQRAFAIYAEAEPRDDALRAFVPQHISPYGRVLEGAPIPEPTRSVLSPKEARVLINYCPFCNKEHPNIEGVGPNMFELDPDNPFHARTICCGQDLYEREADFPDGYSLKPNHVAEFVHLDETVKQVPATIYTGPDGVKWELYIGTTVAHMRWIQTGDMANDWLDRFLETNDPVYVHKLAVLLDLVADTYYGLPPSYRNLVMQSPRGGPLTRQDWEAMSRPVRRDLGMDKKFYWNRRLPLVNCCWLYLFKEYIWVEPFARVRHHPAFKMYSKQTYGDPEALDQKIMRKLMREIALVFESIVLESDYQDGHYTELMVLGILLENEYLFDFAAAHQECVLYNHHYYDGLTAEGAPNYMAMLDGYYRHTPDPGGWLEYAPDFLADNPFFAVASQQWRKLRTIRGEPLEFGDQIIYAFNPPDSFADPQVARRGEQLPSMNWPGYGVGVLRVGGAGHRQEVSLMYDRMTIHGAADKLGIACWVDGVPIMRRGGYAAKGRQIEIDASRPEFKALLKMPYPRQIFGLSSDGTSEHWLNPWTHSHMTQNTASVNELGTSPGWIQEGIGELITFKGGEARGEPGARFQVLDCRDIDSFKHVAEDLRIAPVYLPEYRRTLLAVEGPAGRPYVVDIFRIEGGQRHALFQSAWADRVAEELPPMQGTWENMFDYLQSSPAPSLPDAGGDLKKNYRRLTRVESLGDSAETWSVTWRADHAAYQPFDAQGRPIERALPEGVGIARLRSIGLSVEGSTELLNAKGPWVAWLKQPLPNGENATGDVGFHEAWDYLIERRTKRQNHGRGLFKSSFVNILEGHRDDESSAIVHVRVLKAAPESRQQEGAVAIELTFSAGHSDIVVFQPEAGELYLDNGLATDARYALLRRDVDGRVVEAHLVRGKFLKFGDFFTQTNGDVRGTIVDVIGDLTGTRTESALIVRPGNDWPMGEQLAGRQMVVRTINDHNEAYEIARVSDAGDGLLRVDLANCPPFSSGWYQVQLLDASKGNRLLSSRKLIQGTGNPWWWGAKAWFPERDKTYTIHRTEVDRVTVDFADAVNLRDEGVEPGDWFVLYAIEPGLEVTVPDAHVWCGE